MISVICCTIRDDRMENVFQNYEKQDTMPKELIIVLNRDGIRSAKYDYVAKMNDDDYYAPLYLSQQLKALTDKKADVVCKRTVYMYFERNHTLAVHLSHRGEEMFLEKEWGVKGSTFVFRKSLFDQIDFPHRNLNEDMSFLRQCLDNNYRVYITDKNHYVCLRKPEGLHTWKISNQQLLKESKIIYKTEDYKKRMQKGKEEGNNDNRIALTFDDGPDPKYTPLLLDLLKSFDAKATFFVLGSKLEKHPDLARRIVSVGHELGNHTYSHPNLRKMDDQGIFEFNFSMSSASFTTFRQPAFLRLIYSLSVLFRVVCFFGARLVLRNLHAQPVTLSGSVGTIRRCACIWSEDDASILLSFVIPSISNVSDWYGERQGLTRNLSASIPLLRIKCSRGRTVNIQWKYPIPPI